MKYKKEKEINKKKDNVTDYGEFISSYFAWKTLEEQKNITNKLADITDKDKE